ncbi:hypothetical protein N7508_007320 [Penicillium antarcticum]|uniref:uncharacterized protein n=1 Tax=Penicillium antarcticum TaxID=416450 RepID=UPI0023A754C4|nr:uncharacterized protein N7508_007320 [Penicillium antarcticum]KAJ5300077.1 hypothetical protein N7508_007320 [Penicillium antarcticum]
MLTTYVLCNPDGAIDGFFNSNTTQCDELAISRAGGVSTALQMQGVCSYTVTAGPNESKLFQFRGENSIIDMGNITLAKGIHPEFVASCTMGDSRPFYIYKMEHLPGTARIMARVPRSVPTSWNNDLRPCSDETATLLMEFQSNYDLLARKLPYRFAPNLERVRKELPSLISKAFPFVLSHGDVNPKTGNITGIIDWAESRILPFGFALYGLENLLGRTDSEVWHYYDRYCALESLFWQTFR